uniref:Uncharacterized protein n=1 Tax=Salix viminalis TaxID=40686 RepID=A0A6N2NKJ0_SALVM
MVGDLQNLSQLTVLNVSHNKLSALPAAIEELPMLKLLDVSFNLILKVLDEIGSATSLVKFDCSSNQLRELPSSLGGCLDLSNLKVMLHHDLLMNRCADLFFPF